MCYTVQTLFYRIDARAPGYLVFAFLCLGKYLWSSALSANITVKKCTTVFDLFLHLRSKVKNDSHN